MQYNHKFVIGECIDSKEIDITSVPFNGWGGYIGIRGDEDRIVNVNLKFIEIAIQQNKKFIIINTKKNNKIYNDFIEKCIKKYGYSKYIFITNENEIPQIYENSSYIIHTNYENIDSILDNYYNSTFNKISKQNFQNNEILIDCMESINDYKLMILTDIPKRLGFIMQARSLGYLILAPLKLEDVNYKFICANTRSIIYLKTEYEDEDFKEIYQTKTTINDLFISSNGQKKIKSI